MDRKNRELAKRNTELLEEISRLTDIHSDMLKESIKERYYRTRKYNKLIDQVDNQIKSINEVLEDSLLLRRSLIGILEISEQKKNNEETFTESDTSVFKQTMKILDTIGKYEEDDKVKVSLRSDKKRNKVDTKKNVNKEQSTESIDKVTTVSKGVNMGKVTIEDKVQSTVQITDNQTISTQKPQKKANDEILKEKNLNKPQPKRKRRSVSRR